LLVVQTAHHSLSKLRFAALLSIVSAKAAASLLHASSQQFHFTPRSMERLLERTGFRMVGFETGRAPLRFRPRAGLTPFFADLLENAYALTARLRREHGGFIVYCRPKQP
jgi:hypothetical protein